MTENFPVFIRNESILFLHDRLPHLPSGKISGSSVGDRVLIPASPDGVIPST